MKDALAHALPESLQALAYVKAHRRPRGEALEEFVAQSEHLLPTDVKEQCRRSGIPHKTWGVSLDRPIAAQGRNLRACKSEAERTGGFCVVEANANAYEWMRTLDIGAGSVWLQGEVGTGKSLLASAAVQGLLQAPRTLRRGVGVTMDGHGPTSGVWVDKGMSCMWVTEAELMRAERQHWKRRISGVPSPSKRAANVALLVVDDYLSKPKGKGPSWKEDDMHELWEAVLCERYDGQRPCIFTSNRPMGDVEGERKASLASRVSEMCSGFSLVLGGPDWRNV
jgi:DNA replication protein DnaC